MRYERGTVLLEIEAMKRGQELFFDHPNGRLCFTVFRHCTNRKCFEWSIGGHRDGDGTAEDVIAALERFSKGR